MITAPPVEVAVLDTAGVIVAVNPAWEDFCHANDGDLATCGVGASYLAVCEAAGDDAVAVRSGEAVSAAVAGVLPAPVRLLVPCPGPSGTTWFDMVVYSQFDAAGHCVGAVVTHTPVPPPDGPPGNDVPRSALVPEIAGLDPSRAVDLTGRVSDVSGERDRLRGLLTASRALTTRLDLSEVLEDVVSVARELVGADGAALVVISRDGREPSRFVVSGIDAEHVARLESLPAGDALRRRLVAPIRIREVIFGTLYLADKVGGGQFTAQDEQVLASLAATAAVAIENAQLYQEISWRERWRTAAMQVTTAILADPRDPGLLTRIVGEAERLVGADTVGVVEYTDGDDAVQILAAAGSLGARIHRLHDGRPPVSGTLVDLIREQRPVRSADAYTDDRMPSYRTLVPELGPLLGVPMSMDSTGARVLVAGRRRGRDPFTELEELALTQFARQAALTLELARARITSERLHVLEERQRIARDVHDNVLGRLFGIGLAMQGLRRRLPHSGSTTSGPVQPGRNGPNGRNGSSGTSGSSGEQLLEDLTVELETAISDLRSTIYARDTPPQPAEDPDGDTEPGPAEPGPAEPGLAEPGLAALIRAVIDEAAVQLGFTPETDIDAAVDDLDPDLSLGVGQHLVGVLREALTNAARHAAATAVHVTLTVGDQVELTISDDGRGLPEQRPTPTANGGHGLANMAARARDLGGSCTAGSNRGGGTIVRWSVPDPRRSPALKATP